jgi:hypothetical protein
VEGGGSRANVKKGQFKNKRTFNSRIDQHEEERRRTSKSKDMGGRKRKQIVSPKQSSSSIYSFKTKQKQSNVKSLNKQVSPHHLVFNRGEKRLEKEFAFQQTSTKQSVTFKSQIRQIETNGHKQNKNK